MRPVPAFKGGLVDECRLFICRDHRWRQAGPAAGRARELESVDERRFTDGVVYLR
jgi:hypothetical protein